MSKDIWATTRVRPYYTTMHTISNVYSRGVPLGRPCEAWEVVRVKRERFVS